MKKQTDSRSKAAAKSKAPASKKKATGQATKAATQSSQKATRPVVERKSKALAVPKPVTKPIAETLPARPATSGRPRRATGRAGGHVTRVATTSAAAAQHRQVVRMARVSQFNFMRAPGISDAFDVGDTVEVFCDHEKNGERVRGWIKGIVVQVDNKLVAVQFRSNVFLTDGWMVPDRILWYSLTSDQIRPATFAKRGGPKAIPDY